MIRVVLADDQALMRRGLTGLLSLEEDIDVVGEAADGEEAIDLIRRLRPDVALVDVRMPDLSGIDVLDRLRADDIRVRTILLTTFDDDAALIHGAAAGARAYLLKDVSVGTLTDTIRKVARGQTVLGPAISQRILDGLRELDAASLGAEAPQALTRRETEVLRLMAGGYSNREISTALGASEGTIKNHASSIFSKLGVRDRTQAVLKALDRGWI